MVSVPVDMKPEDIVASLCRLAADLKLERNMSLIALLRRSGYSAGAPLSEDVLESHLRVHPELVESWLDYRWISATGRHGGFFLLLTTRDGPWAINPMGSSIPSRTNTRHVRSFFGNLCVNMNIALRTGVVLKRLR
jgi:hypothetical protein